MVVSGLGGKRGAVRVRLILRGNMQCDTSKEWGLQGRPRVEQETGRGGADAWAAGSLSPGEPHGCAGCAHLLAARVVMGGRHVPVGSSSSSC